MIRLFIRKKDLLFRIEMLESEVRNLKRENEVIISECKLSPDNISEAVISKIKSDSIISGKFDDDMRSPFKI